MVERPVVARSGSVSPGAVRLATWVLSGLLLLFGAVTFAAGGMDAVSRQEPLDLNINLVAAQRLVDRAAVYDAAASRPQALAIGGPSMEGSFTEPTNGFAGPPVTALLHVPFLAFDHQTGVAVFRLAALLGMVGAVVVTAQVLPRSARRAGIALGTGALLSSFATIETLKLGQGHEFVMLALAVVLWASATGRWRAAGAGIAVATMLKVGPVVLLAYLLVRCAAPARRQLLTGFVGAGALLTVAAAVVGRPQDVFVWLRDIAPELSGGVVRTINQSLPAFLSRLLGDGDLASTAPLGPIRYLAVIGMVGGVVWLLRARRGRAFDPMEIGVLIVLGLVLGPLTWMHYATWAVLPIVLLADPRRWVGTDARAAGFAAGALVLSLVLFTVNVVQPAVPAVGDRWPVRLTSSPVLLAELILLWVLARRHGAEPPVGGQALGMGAEAR